MFKPMFNHVLVEVDSKSKEWGGGNNDNIGGEAYREGVALDHGTLLSTAEHPVEYARGVIVIHQPMGDLMGKHIMWNEGHEAGTVFEEDGKTYALIYWWDIIGVEA